MTTAVSIENLWKEYRLGIIGHGTLTQDLQSWWARVRGKVDPNVKVGLRPVDEGQIDGKRFWALRRITLSIDEGDVIGIIGKNGAGKSTLLKILSRVTAPSIGTVRIKGRIASLLEVGTGFHPELTGRENIFLNGSILGMTKKEIRSKLEEIVDFSGIESFIDTPVKRYSSGMRVRLGFAVAAHLDPEILIVDEVLAVGDMEFQKKCLKRMEKIGGEGRTVLFVSHNMGAIKTLTKKGVYLNSGCIDKVGRTNEVIDRYLKDIEKDNPIDVSAQRRPSNRFGREIKISEVRPVSNNNGGFFFGQDLLFEVDVQSSINRDKLRFGITIVDLLGNPIAAIFTSEQIHVKKNKRFKFKVIINKLYLSPGRYRISISIGHGTIGQAHKNFDVIQNGPIFEVLNIGVDGLELMNWNKSWGYIFHPKGSAIILHERAE